MTNKTIEIQLTQGQVALIDQSDFDLVSKYKWYAIKNGNNFYAMTNIRKADGKRTSLQLHKLLLDTPKGLHTDHIDHNGLNNCRSNLRICSASQNQMNMRSNKNSTSKFKGVSLIKTSNKWRATIQINKKLKHLGCFTSEQEAALAYNTAATQYHGSFANLNRIGDV